MIACDVGGDNVAGHVDEYVLDERNAAGRPAKAHAESGFCIFGLLGLGEEFGELLLTGFEDVDAELAALIEDGEHLCAFGNADEDEERFERDGGEGVGGHAVDAARRAFRGDDGDAGGEVCAALTKLDGSDGGGGHRRICEDTTLDVTEAKPRLGGKAVEWRARKQAAGSDGMARRIAILGGTGPEGSGLAYRWAKAGVEIVIGSRDAARAKEVAAQLNARVGAGAKISGTDNATAVGEAEVVVLTVPFPGVAALLKQLKTVWKPGQIVIDTTVPLAATVGGAATRVLGVWQGSAAEQTRELLPKEVALAAALQNLGAELLVGDAPVDCDVLVCGDDERAKSAAAELVEKIPGARALNGGKLENARIVESMTALLIGLNIRYKVHSAGIRFTGLM